MVLIYATMFAATALAILATPFYLAYELARLGRRAWERRSTPAESDDDAVRALRDSYAAGALSVETFEAGLEAVLEAKGDRVVDLPRERHRLGGAVAFDVFAGVLLLVLAGSPRELAFGALLCLGALVPVRGRVPVYAFLAGLALLAAPLATVPLAASALRRWFDER